jgi:hypothetical protein
MNNIQVAHLNNIGMYYFEKCDFDRAFDYFYRANNKIALWHILTETVRAGRICDAENMSVLSKIPLPVSELERTAELFSKIGMTDRAQYALSLAKNHSLRN